LAEISFVGESLVGESLLGEKFILAPWMV
jgi:hypothetical protein